MATATKATSARADMADWARAVRARNDGCYIDEQAWIEVFRTDLRDWSPKEIIETAAWMQSEGQDWPAVKCASDLVKAVRTMRKQGRASRQGGDGARSCCGHCKDGLLQVWRGWRETWTAADYQRAMTGVIPCECPAGGHAATSFSPWREQDDQWRDRLRRYATTAKRAIEAYRQVTGRAA